MLRTRNDGIVELILFGKNWTLDGLQATAETYDLKKPISVEVFAHGLVLLGAA